MDRRTARKEALCLLFDYSFNEEKDAAALLEGAAEARELKADKYLRRVVGGVIDEHERIDEVIEANLKGWKKERLSRTALAVLRIAIYEIDRMDGIPRSVSINEAVELAKSYGDEKDAPFVNGLLGSYVRSLDPEDAAKSAAAEAESETAEEPEREEDGGEAGE